MLLRNGIRERNAAKPNVHWKEDMTKIITILIGLLAVTVAFPVSADDGVDRESGYYSFISGELVAAYESGFLPVLYGDRRGVYVDTDRGIKRIRYSTECRLISKMGISDQIVTIADAKYGFDNLRQAQLETDAVSEMMQNEAATETAIIMKGGGIAGAPPGGLNEEVQAEINEMKALQAETSGFVQESLEYDAYGRGELSDIINVRFDLFSEADLENVYCAMLVRYLQKNRDTSGKLAKARIVRMKKIGNLVAGRPNRVRFSYPLPEGFVSNKGIEIFLFSGEGKPLATNLSRNLNPLTVEELGNIYPQR